MASKVSEAMSAVAAEAAKDPLWKLLSEYYEARAIGLRDRANVAAEKFTGLANNWNFEERKRFSVWLVNRVSWLMDQTGHSKFTPRYSTGGSGLFAPFKVVETILLPTLLEWKNEEPRNPQPHFWLGLYSKDSWPHLREAIRLDPAHGPARMVLIDLIFHSLDYNQHELPSGYLGDIAADLSDIDEASLLLVEALTCKEVETNIVTSLEQQVLIYRKNVKDWLRLRDQFKGVDWEVRKSIWAGRHDGQQA